METLYSLPMTIPLCRRHCVSYGYGLAVLYTDHCRCVYDDSYLLPYNVTYDGNCNHACPGDASTKCGGDGSTDVYMSVYEAYGEFHYENTPIQIYRKFHLQKLKIFR